MGLSITAIMDVITEISGDWKKPSPVGAVQGMPRADSS
jgi:hypothetical protein